MTAPNVQGTTLEHLDFPTLCGEDGCERPADFVERCRFCRYSDVICGTHLTEYLERDKHVPGWGCDGCLHQEADLLALIAISLLRP